MPTLAEVLAMPAGDRPKTSTTVTLVKGQHLVNEEQRLVDEHNDLLVQAEKRARDVEDGKAEPRKSGEGAGAAARLEELKAALAEMKDRLAKFQGDVGLRGLTPGEWQLYKDEHPPRDDSREDRVVARGWVNASYLLNDLGRFVETWDGEEVAAGIWDASLAQKIMAADLAQLVRDVVDMHQERVPRVPKAPTSPSTGNDAIA